MISEELILEAKNYPMEQLLSELGVAYNGHNYQCPFHGNGAEEHYSSWVVPNTNRFYCLSCQKDTDTIEVYQYLTGKDFKSTIIALTGSNSLSMSCKPNRSTTTQKIQKPLKTQNTSNERHIEDYREAMTCYTRYEICNTQQKHLIDAFLEERKLYNALETLNSNGYSIGLRKYKGYSNIAFDLGTFVQTRSSKRKYDNGTLSISKLRVNDNMPAVIVEGISDALAVAECGYNVVCLNGVANYVRLKLRATGTYYVLLDNDSAGTTTTQKIISEWRDKVISIEDISEILVNHNVKDIGELVQQGKGGELSCLILKK